MASAEQAFLLSPQQRRTWIEQGEAGPWLALLAVRLDGALDRATLRQAADDVVAEHEVLRTGFRSRRGMRLPVQVVAELSSARWIETPLLGEDAPTAPPRRLLEKLGSLPLDLGQGGLLRLALVPRGPEEYLLLLALPVLCADPGTLERLVGSLARAYGARAAGEPPEAGTEPLQYVDFVDWQEELAESSAEAVAFWTRSWASLPASPRPAGEGPGVSSERACRRIGGLGVELEAAAAARRSTGEALLLAAWCLLLGRLEASADLAVGIYLANRRPETDDCLGLLGGYLPVRVRLPAEQDFCHLAAQTSRLLERMRSRQECGLWALGSPERETLPIPSRFAFRGPRHRHAGAGVGFTATDESWTGAAGSLELRVRLQGEDLWLELLYASHRLGPGSVDAALWLARLEGLLRAVVASPGEALGAIPLLAPGEEHRLRFEVNDSAAPTADPRPLHRRIRSMGEAATGLPAVVFEDRVLTFGELLDASGDLARRLRGAGVEPESRVAILLPRSDRVVVAMLGILEAGAAYVPLDLDHPRRRLEELLGEAGVELAVAEADQAPWLRGLGIEAISPAPQTERPRPQKDGAELPVAADPWDSGARLAYVLFTSGSSGRPKGVAVEHRQLSNYVDGIVRRLAPPVGSSFATVSTFAADLGNTMIFPALALGGTLHVVSPERARDPRALVEYQRRHRIDYLKIVPSHLRGLLAAPGAEALLPRRALVLGGEVCDGALVSRILEAGPACRIFNHYGPTETTVGVSVHELSIPPAVEDEAVPLGTPLANAALLVLDPWLRLVPTGVAGELCIGGASVARGYLGRPARTAASFVPRPGAVRPGDRLYRSGDRVMRRVGSELVFLGRLDDQVKVRGHRVELSEIRAALMTHPKVRDAAVVVRPDTGRPVAFVVLRSAGETGSSLRSFLHERLPEPAVPAAVIPLDRLPLTANGKPDRSALQALELETAERRIVAPRTPLERQLAGIWSGILGIEEVGADENFFELGGDSVLAILAAAEARRAGLVIDPKHLFAHQTVEALAIAVAGAAEPADPGLPEPVSGPAPLTPIQAWFWERDLAEPGHWNQAMLIRPKQELPGAILAAAVTELVRVHEALCMRFGEIDGRWRQVATEGEARSSSAFLEVDLSALPPRVASRAFGAVAGRAQRGLDPRTGKLFRAVRVRLPDAEGERLLLVAHHLAVDAVSWRILLDDLFAFCSPHRRGEIVSGSGGSTSVRRWALLLEEAVSRRDFSDELEYWRTSVPRRWPALPRDLDGQNLEGHADIVTMRLDERRSRALLQEALAAYRLQPLELIVAAVARGVSAWSGHDGLLVKLEGHGREALFDGVDLSRTVGWFTTHFPVCVDLAGAADLAEVVIRTKETLRGVPRQGIGFGLLRHFGAPEEADALRELPDPEVKLNYLGNLDRMYAESESFAAAGEPVGPIRSPVAERDVVFEVLCGFLGGRFQMRVLFGREVHRKETVERLAEEVIAALATLVDHCLEPDSGRPTPSDFPLAGLDRERLDAVLHAVAPGEGRPADGRAVQDVYPMSPLQRSLLYHTLTHPETTVGFEQKTTLVRGRLDRKTFSRSWRLLVERHPILRTGFVWDGVAVPLAVVLGRSELHVTFLDWSDRSAEERERRLAEELRRDRARGFDLYRPPLMRVVLIRLGEEAHQLIWSYSHLLLDAWCRTLLLRELFAVYEALAAGERPALPARTPYRSYIAWLSERDHGSAEAFWRSTLAGITTVPTLPVGWLETRDPARDDRQAMVPLRVPDGTSAALTAFAAGQHLTLGLLVQGAWAILVSRYTGARDVLFGTTVAGRPAALPGADTILGVFSNNIPVRAGCAPEDRVGPWLAALQERVVAAREYEWCATDQIQEWSEVPWGQRLIDSLVLFQNHPRVATERPVPALELVSPIGRLETGYPLAVVVGAQEGLSGALVYNPTRFDLVDVERLARHFTALLAGLAEDPERAIGAVPLLDAEEYHQVVVEWGGGHRRDDGRTEDLLDRRLEDLGEAIGLAAGRRLLSLRSQPEAGNLDLRLAEVAGCGIEVAAPERIAGSDWTQDADVVLAPTEVLATLAARVVAGGGVSHVVGFGPPPCRGLVEELAEAGVRWSSVFVDATGLPILAARQEPGAPPRLGRPLPGVEVRIGPPAGEPCPVGVPGPLEIRDRLAAGGAALALRGRWRNDGYLDLLALDHREIEIRGSRVELGLVEAALRQHPALRSVAVDRWQYREGEWRIVAHVVPRGGRVAPRADRLREFVAERLPRVMVPAVFVTAEELPLRDDGSVDRDRLPGPREAGRRSEQAYVSPRDDLERLLVRIWEDLFGLHPLGIRDDFFGLGGHSLLAVRLIGKLPEELGRDLPLATLIEAPTVERLAAVLRRRSADAPWSPLVQLQRGNRDRPPVFCVHPAGTEVLCFFDLAAGLGPDQPFYGLQGLIGNGGEERHESIEEMALCYLEAVRGVQPHGPYYLAGYSFGGLVALEMACRLEELGERVGLLAILDTRLEAREGQKRWREASDEELILQHVQSNLDGECPVTLEELREQGSLDRQISFALRRIHEAGLFPPNWDRYDIELLRRRALAFGVSRLPWAKYRPRPYAGQVTLFRASEGHVVQARDPLLGWGDIAAEVRVLEVSGDHDSLLLPPHVQHLAEALRGCLDRLQEPARSALSSGSRE